MKKLVSITIAVLIVTCGCDVQTRSVARVDSEKTLAVGDKLSARQPTPTDVDYSLERYNLIRRTYWVNGMRERARAFPCPMQKPLGNIVLFSQSGAIVGKFIVDGKVSSLNSFLAPNSEYYEKCNAGTLASTYAQSNKWLPDVDGAYGENDKGIFFFTPDGKYIEWTGTYLYSDIPFEVGDPMVRIGVRYE